MFFDKFAYCSHWMNDPCRSLAVHHSNIGDGFVTLQDFLDFSQVCLRIFLSIQDNLDRKETKMLGFYINLHVQFSTRLLFACQLIQRKCSLCSQGTTRQKVCFVILTQLKKDYNGTDKNASLKHYKHCGLFKITVICFLSSILNRIQPCCLQQLMQDSWTLKTPSLQPYF